MNKLMNYRYRIITLLVLAVVLSAATYGFAAANTVPDGVAGEGSGGISGYTVTNVNYLLDSNDPTSFDSVSFDLSAAASDVYAGLSIDDATISWVGLGDCLSTGGFGWSCDLSGSSVSVRDAYFLHVSAAE
jgi:hypothetical protein